MRFLAILVLLSCGMRAEAADRLALGPAPGWVHPAPAPSNAVPTTTTPTRVLLDDQQLDLSGGVASTWRELVTRIQTPQGLDAVGTITLPWDPAIDRLTVHRLRVIRGATVIDVLARKHFTVLRRENNLDSAMLDGVLTAVLQPADLRIGDVLDLAYTTSRADPAMHGTLSTVAAFDAGEQADRLALHVQWPTRTPMHWRPAPDLPDVHPTSDARLSVLDWSETGAEPLAEPEQAPPRFLRRRDLALSQFASWADVAALLVPLCTHAETLPAGSALRAEISRIKASSAGPLAQAEAALALVQNPTLHMSMHGRGIAERHNGDAAATADLKNAVAAEPAVAEQYASFGVN